MEGGGTGGANRTTEEVVSRYDRLLRGVARRHARDYPWLKDDFWSACLEAAWKLTGREQLTAGLVRKAANHRCLDRLKEERRHNREAFPKNRAWPVRPADPDADPDGAEDAVDVLPNEVESGLSLMLLGEQWAPVEKHLSHLTADQRELVWEHVYGEKTFEELGRARGLTAAGVHGRYTRALSKLRKRLKADRVGEPVPPV